VFDKVSKNVMEIKDIKRIDDNKMNGPFQIEFSQRAEWDIGLSSASESYAEFYSGLETKYYKHPFYNGTHQGRNATYDLVQIIGEENLVGFAAYWPPLISKWVTNAEDVRRYSLDVDVPSLLDSMETYEHMVELPTDADQLVDPSIMYVDGKIVILLPKPAVSYPRGMGEWSAAPWVFKKDQTGDYASMYMMQGPFDTSGAWWYKPEAGPYGAVVIKPFQWNWGDEFNIVYKRVMQGHTIHNSTALDCMPMFDEDEWTISLGMYSEPDTPYVFGEWDFDLDMDHPENSTHQFRAVSVYGITDNHNAVDPDQQGPDVFRIDREIVYQLERIFNPWDLKDASHTDTFRWAQKGPIASVIVLANHASVEPDHEVWIPSKWGYYCNDSEKVLVYGGTGEMLLVRDEDYTIDDDTITIIDDHDADTYKVLYTTKLEGEADWHDGRWEWTVIGQDSHASDSLGTTMLTAGWMDWKNKEVWLSGLDVESEVFGPAIPRVLRKFADTETPDRFNYRYDYSGGDSRAAFRDDWCTPDDWDGSTTIRPYAISSANIQVVGGPIVNEAASYFNDFTDALVFTGYGDGYYGPGCWARTTQDHYQGDVFMNVDDDELWYSSTTVDDDIGYAIVSTYKDLNETVGFIVYGYTAEDTYYVCYALRGGLLPMLQELQDGATTIIVEIDYSDLHPVSFHVKESLGGFTECTGFGTSFKTHGYYDLKGDAMDKVDSLADNLGLKYKLIDIDWCAQIHPDP
jgi:hypothetical protein